MQIIFNLSDSVPLPKGSGSRKIIPMPCRQCGKRSPGWGRLGPFVEQANIATKTRPAHALTNLGKRIAAAAIEAMGNQPPTDLPVILRCTFQLVKPQSVRREHPTVPPDLDKLARTVADALPGICYLNDSQIVELACRKEYARTPGIRIEVSAIDRQLGLL